MQRQYRLRHRQDFERLRREGRTFRTEFMTLSLRSNGLEHNRYGFITSKQLGSAVVRNRVRRLMREAVRLMHPRAQAGFDVVLVARKPLVEQPFASFQRIIERLAREAGLIGLQE